jgi:hypothetical protein
LLELGPKLTIATTKTAVEMRRGEKNRMIGKKGGVKRSKMPKETKGCLHARPNNSDTTRSAIIVLHREL